MAQHHVSVNGTVDAPIDVVWDLLADARGFSSWAFMSVSTLERWGDPEPDGVGAIRNLGSAGVVSREQIVEFEPPHHLAYVLLSGLPIENYRADVHLTETPSGGCSIEWRGRFDAGSAMGAVMRRFLTFVLGDFVRRLKTEAPKRAAAAPANSER